MSDGRTTGRRPRRQACLVQGPGGVRDHRRRQARERNVTLVQLSWFAGFLDDIGAEADVLAVASDASATAKAWAPGSCVGAGRVGQVRLGAVERDERVATNSSAAAWTLRGNFAALLDPDLSVTAARDAIGRWQDAHFGPAALARREYASARGGPTSPST